MELSIEEVTEALVKVCGELCEDHEAHAELYDAYVHFKHLNYHMSKGLDPKMTADDRHCKLRDIARQAVCALAVAVEKAS